MNFPLPHLLGTLGALAASATLVVNSTGWTAPDRLVLHETVEVTRRVIEYPLPGEFLKDGRPVTAPLEERTVPAFSIMKAQVSLAEYGLCVAAGGCRAADAGASAPFGHDVPVTGVSFLDAQAYATWYSQASGETWRLPSDVEIAAAAGEHFTSEPPSQAADDPANPAVRWLRLYAERSAAKRLSDPSPKPRGFFGANMLGVEDFGGNVWEWTSTCYDRVTIALPGERAQEAIVNCGVHVLEGRHRSYMSNFVRDAKSGGCTVASPPDHLGFRLVRGDTSLLASLTSAVGRTLVSILPPVR